MHSCIVRIEQTKFYLFSMLHNLFIDTLSALKSFENTVNGQFRPVHPPYSSVFSTEFNPEYGNTDLLFWLRKRSSPKYGNAHGHLNIFLR